jgi:hypothetical protein
MHFCKSYEINKKTKKEQKKGKEATGPNLAQARILPTAHRKTLPNRYVDPSFSRW